MTSDAERLARLEGAYEHLATKADLKHPGVASDKRSPKPGDSVDGTADAGGEPCHGCCCRRRPAMELRRAQGSTCGLVVRELHVERGFDAGAFGGRVRGGERRRADTYGHGGREPQDRPAWAVQKLCRGASGKWLVGSGLWRGLG